MQLLLRTRISNDFCHINWFYSFLPMITRLVFALLCLCFFEFYAHFMSGEHSIIFYSVYIRNKYPLCCECKQSVVWWKLRPIRNVRWFILLLYIWIACIINCLFVAYIVCVYHMTTTLYLLLLLYVVHCTQTHTHRIYNIRQP